MQRPTCFKTSVKKREVNLKNDSNKSGSDASVSPGDKLNEQIWNKFDDLPPLPGFLASFIVVFHDERILLENDRMGLPYEKLNPEKIIKEEKNLTIELAKYLIHNGLEIRVVCTGNFSQPTVPSFAHDDNDDEDEPTYPRNVVDVTIVVLFPNTMDGLIPLLNHQKNMANLVAESVEASRKGVIILGNITHLDGIQGAEWESFITYVNVKRLWKNSLELYCPRHQFTNDEIYTAFDMRQATLLGGCKSFCESKVCGHVCPFVCHSEDVEHRTEKYRCIMRCSRICELGHQCKRACWEECLCEENVIIEYLCQHLPPAKVLCHRVQKMDCRALVKRLLECGHTIKVKCAELRSTASVNCQWIVRKELPCNHEVVFYCKNKDSFLQINCKVPLLKKFPCGHTYLMSCHDCHNREDIKCAQICNKLLKCGHLCEKVCHSDDPRHKFVVCKRPCKKKCARGVHSCRGTHPCSNTCPPCSETYEYKLACSHLVTIKCSEPDLDENNYQCTQVCTSVHMSCGHACAKLCGEDCGKCEVHLIRRAAGCPMDHRIIVKCHESKTAKCTEKVLLLSPNCDHIVAVKCHESGLLSPEELSLRCNVVCQKLLDSQSQCGHVCAGNCKDCNLGRFHARCNTPCDKILICGHNCMTPCYMLCSPCPMPCLYSCKHRKCELECGVPCYWDCDEPCPYRCKHSKCSKKCSEVCNKKLCTEPCPKILACGHACVGFCGEVCPPLCRYCNAKELMVGLLMVKPEITEDERFIFLEGCGHCIDSWVMDQWMKVDDDDDEVLAKRCPVCRTRLKWLCRYSEVMHKNRQLIDAIRVKIFGDADEIRMVISNVQGQLERFGDPEFKSHFFPEFFSFLSYEMNQPHHVGPDGGCEFKSMSIGKAKFIEWVLNEWVTGCETMKELAGALVEQRYSRVKEYWWDLLDIVSRRVWPMHPNEMKDYAIERVRIMDAVELYSRLYKVDSNQTTDLIYSGEGAKAFANCEDAVFRHQQYTQPVRKIFLTCFKEFNGVLNCTLKITDEERLEIVSAFGERSGRWFKCSNGHVYVITECGGATQIGTCNVCGTVIGGEQHVLAEDNFLATEMDGADDPLYPTALSRRPSQNLDFFD